LGIIEAILQTAGPARRTNDYRSKSSYEQEISLYGARIV
jgi:hypothetical protein